MIFRDYKITGTEKHFVQILSYYTFPNVDLFHKAFNFIIQSKYIATSFIKKTS